MSDIWTKRFCAASRREGMSVITGDRRAQKRQIHLTLRSGSIFQPGGRWRRGAVEVKGREMERPAWSDPTDSWKETEQVAGKEGTSKNASLMKMKSIKEGREVEEH
jgi:hypothetical protein